MKLHLRADSAIGAHTYFTIFMNGSNCGQLCMTEDEALFFHHRLLSSRHEEENDNIFSSGIWTKEEGEM